MCLILTTFRYIKFSNNAFDTTSFFSQEFNVVITEEFLEHCLEGALSIEVYGHRSAGFAQTEKWDERRQLAKSLADRWSELTRKLEFHVEVHELGDGGEYSPVEVQPRTNVGTGGIFQLRQGQQ